MANQDDKDFYSTRITAKVLGVSRVTVFRYIQSGKLDAMRFKGDYYVCQSDLDLFLINHRTSQAFRDEALRLVHSLRDHVIEDRLDTIARTASDISDLDAED